MMSGNSCGVHKKMKAVGVVKKRGADCCSKVFRFVPVEWLALVVVLGDEAAGKLFKWMLASLETGWQVESLSPPLEYLPARKAVLRMLAEQTAATARAERMAEARWRGKKTLVKGGKPAGKSKRKGTKK